MRDRKHVKGTRSRGHTSWTSAPTISRMGSERVNAIRNAKLAVVLNLGIKGSQQGRRCLRSQEVCRASTLSTLIPILLCPVTGKQIPPLEKIEEKIEKGLILSNWRWPKSVAIKGIALVLQKWAVEVGLERAAKRADMLFGMPEPMRYADQANMPWLKLETLPQLTPEEFADRLGGIVDGIERTINDANKECYVGDQCLLSGNGSAFEDGGAGSEPGIERTSGGDSKIGDGRSEEGGRVIALRSRGTSGKSDGISRRLVLLELREHQADLKAFQDAYGCVHRRVQEVKDENQLMMLVGWSGTSAVMGSLELAIHAMERVVEELKQLLLGIDAGAIPNSDED